MGLGNKNDYFRTALLGATRRDHKTERLDSYQKV